MVSAVNCVYFFRLCHLCMAQTSFVDSKCPSDPLHGCWDEDTRNNQCKLRCDSGYEPSDCHIIRYSQKERKWNHEVPSCQKKWHVSGKTMAVVGTGVAAAVVATPLVLAGAGFTSAGSLAAMFQAPCTAPGSWFALAQSACVVGTAVTTKGAVGAVAGAITYATSSAFSNCEAE
ncbi:uncharacterized protein LOC128162179 [Crassostrea angulata]|uniref:uncharacterized protein LOC128162179 n=1 Tax=Magallana angulata TaxID=2784310 RepID=UPI0022B1D7F9|nr:uncharacterized protein LOC128162179 [Crassostrea angulata]